MSFSKWKALVLVLPLLTLSHLALAEKSAAIPLGGDTVEICLVPSEQVNAENCEPGNWLFLPTFAQREEAVLLIDEARQSMPVLSPVMGEEGVFSGSTDSGETLYVMQSQNLRTLFLFSDDPENQGRQWVENCERHENEAQASMALVAVDGTVDYAGHIKKLRGRGNGTWRWAKKPYQLKLDDKADLLNLGDPDERNRTWVLLALATDATMLHDRVALDLGLEMGLNETSHSEHVDLYYDGEYRGTYLLCEKVEVGKGRVNEMNSTKLVEQLNEAVGQENLEDLPTEEGINNFGQTYAWVEGVQGPENPADLAYLVELESPYTLSNQGWFHVEDGGLFGCKNPKYPNREMVAYISEKLASARLALQNGTDIEKNFDVDGFARVALINELAYNIDGFTNSSSFFALPAGGGTFRPGPLWDFELAFHYLNAKDNTQGFKSASGWLTDGFYRSHSFLQAMKNIYQQELYPLITDVLLGNRQGRYLQPLAAYEAQIVASRRMNDRLHQVAKEETFLYGETARQDTELMAHFLQERSQWLNKMLEAACNGQVEFITVEPSCVYLDVENTLSLKFACLGQIELLDTQVEQVQEATEERGAIYRLEARLRLTDGYCFADDVRATKGVETHLDGDELIICCLLEDASYKMIELDGQDYGMVFDYNWYSSRHPDVVKACGNDPQAVLEYFVTEDMYKGRMGNQFFSPILTAQKLPDVAEDLGEVWELYYQEFMDYAYEDWPARMETYIELKILPSAEEIE